MFQVSGRDGNLSLGCSRHRICWFPYLSSLAWLIQSFVVILQGSICNSCTFLNKIQRFLTRVFLMWYCGRTHLFGLEWLQLAVRFIFEGLSDDGYQTTFPIKSSCLAAIMFSTLRILKISLRYPLDGYGHLSFGTYKFSISIFSGAVIILPYCYWVLYTATMLHIPRGVDSLEYLEI